jgi:CrcB protein
MQIFLIAFFGAIGVSVRYLVDRQIGALNITEFPLSTFLINCIGSFAIGIIAVLGSESEVLSKDLTIILTVGLLGGFTTLSAFSIQTIQLFERGQYLFAATYFAGTPILGVICATAGVYVTRMIGL